MEARQDYRLKAKSELNGKGVEPGSANGISLHPTREYVHPHATRMLPPGLALSPGAFQVPGP